MEKVGLVMVNYKDYAKNFLDECRDSLRAQTFPKEITNVYIVDNASSPETVEYLNKTYPEAIVVPREDGNYSAANNAGIKKAKEDGCKYFVIVNMDVKFDEHWLEELVKAIKSDKKIGFVQSMILLYPKNDEEWKKPKINSIGNVSHYLGFGFTRGYNEPLANYPDQELQPIKGYSSGCSFITTDEVLEKIGGYDEEYYMYHDDLEMSWRLKLAGYKIMMAPKSIMYHKYEFARSVRMLYYMERNRFLAIFSYYKWLTIVLFLPALAFMELGMWAYAILNGWIMTKIKVKWYFWKPSTWKHIFRVRKEVKILRKVKDKDIIKDFSGKIEFQEIANPLLKHVANPILNFYFKVISKLIFW